MKYGCKMIVRGVSGVYKVVCVAVWVNTACPLDAVVFAGALCFSRGDAKAVRYTATHRNGTRVNAGKV